uniref:Uncharacterized protein n=1 Tax=Arundo donax TaxID=35708 RepID=A0A0A9E6Y1_ARUDO
MNHSTTGLTEKSLNPVTRSSIVLPGVEHNSIRVPRLIVVIYEQWRITCHLNNVTVLLQPSKESSFCQ